MQHTELNDGTLLLSLPVWLCHAPEGTPQIFVGAPCLECLSDRRLQSRLWEEVKAQGLKGSAHKRVFKVFREGSRSRLINSDQASCQWLS
jgi:hypothetical protein